MFNKLKTSTLLLNSLVLSSAAIAAADLPTEIPEEVDELEQIIEGPHFLENTSVNLSKEATVVKPFSKARSGGDISETWWLDWSTISKSPALLREGHTCETLAQEQSVTTIQQDVLMDNCDTIAFYDSFDTEEGNRFKTLAGKKPVVALTYGSFKKWNSYGPGAMLLKHKSIWAQASADGDGYVASLSSIMGSAKIETRGAINLPAGSYKLMFKLKASTQKILPKYAGVTSTIIGKWTNIKQHSYVRSLYTNPYWDTVEIDFNLPLEDNVILSIEDIFNGMNDRGSIVDDIILLKVINEGDAGA